MIHHPSENTIPKGGIFMCTAITYKTKTFYFGRTLDYDHSYGEAVVITPRFYPFSFCTSSPISAHYAIIGMAHIEGDYPLYYDAVNEKGLAMAGLNFVGNAAYQQHKNNVHNIAPHDFIPWILSQCASVKEVRACLAHTNLVNRSFNDLLPTAQLHWMIADESEAIVVESVAEGLMIYDNPVGVLTNNPSFPQQLFHLNNFMHLSPDDPENHFSHKLSLTTYSRGMGALGLPGDLSSQSRFVRASFTKLNAVSHDSEEDSVNQFFHILGSVEQSRGCCKIKRENQQAAPHSNTMLSPSAEVYEITLYTSCCSAGKGIYYYTTYQNHQITAVDIHQADLDSDDLVQYPLITREQIRIQN